MFPQPQNICPPLASSVSWEACTCVLEALCSSRRGVVDTMFRWKLCLPITADVQDAVSVFSSGLLGPHLPLIRSQEPTRPWTEPSAGVLRPSPVHRAQTPVYVLHTDGEASELQSPSTPKKTV